MSAAPPEPAVRLPWAQAIWQRPNQPHPAWTTHGLPPPSLAESDRAARHDPSVVSLGVALDILSTYIGQIAPSPLLLSQLAEAAWIMGGFGQEEPRIPQTLLELADGPVGDERARVGPRLASHAQAAAQPIWTPQAPATSRPEDLAEALTQLRKATEQVINEASLLLSTRRIRDLRP